MHINNQKLSFDIFMVGNLLNIFMEHDLNILMIFGITDTCIFLTTQCIVGYCSTYTRAVMTASVLQVSYKNASDRNGEV